MQTPLSARTSPPTWQIAYGWLRTRTSVTDSGGRSATAQTRVNGIGLLDRDGPRAGAAADSSVVEAGGAGGFWCEEIPAVHQHRAVHARGQGGQVEIVELAPFRNQHQRVALRG